MSYDIELVDKQNCVIEVSEPHGLKGGTYALQETRLHLNITYNYSKYFYEIFGKQGIRFLYGKTAEETIPHLQEAIDLLKDDSTDDYWEPTEGNAKLALQNLLQMAKLAPQGIWRGD